LRLVLALIFLRVPIGFVMADHASGRGTEKSVVTGNVPGDAANHRSLDAAFGLRRSRRQGYCKRQGSAAKKVSHRIKLRSHSFSIRSPSIRSGALQLRRAVRSASKLRHDPGWKPVFRIRSCLIKYLDSQSIQFETVAP
jgi:hypothetical protein